MTSLTCAGCQAAYADSALFCPNCGRAKDRAGGNDALIGKLLGDRFQVIDRIGQGGSGTIYRAEHITLRRKVAVKILHDELSRDDLAVERFRREATTVAEIDNEHIVEIHDFGRTPDGRLYLAMELLEGETLDHVLAREKQLSFERAADILIQVGEALMEAHAIGYVHRDIRPRNIYLANRRGKANFVKLLDFGLAKLVDTDAQAASTSVGMTFGDPRYMSPEQARGDRIDRRADIYQLGCVCYEMLTGAPPFTGNRVFDILTKQVSEAPQPLPSRRPGVPLWMEAAAAKMLAKDPENRFATTTRMVDALKRGLETGEVMEDEVARRRESVPPPSVSRVMQKMGITPEVGTPRLDRAGDRVGDPNVTAKGVTPTAPAPAAPAPRPATPTPPPKQDSIDLVRKRTGTPQLGVPVVPAASTEHASSASGTIDPPSGPTASAESYSVSARSAAETRARVRSPSSAPAPRTRRPTGDPGDSQAWFDEGDRESDEAEAPRKKPKFQSPSTTDMSMYDEPARRSKGALFAVIGVVIVIGGVAFALTRGGNDDKKSTTPETPSPVLVELDAGPSQIINETPDAGVAIATPDAGATIVARPNTGGTRPTTGGTPTGPVAPTGPIDPGAFVLGGGPTNPTNPTGPTDPYAAPGTGSGSGTTVVIIPGGVGPTPNTGSGSGVSGGPQDPYHDGPDPNGGSAEQLATQGQQQLNNGDATNAAINFKKALELDPNNAVATLGMGDIASRQGLYGAAIGHLTKAARLAPRNAYVFVLLGEAYLRSGSNTKAALDNFKKALALDPNNARARDGFNEASAKTPPPTDEE